MRVAAKFIIVLHLIVLGAIFLMNGFGADLPVFKYNGVEAYNIPAGIVLCLIGLAVAVFWKIEEKKSETERIYVKTKNGDSVTITRTSTSEAKFMPAERKD